MAVVCTGFWSVMWWDVRGWTAGTGQCGAILCSGAYSVIVFCACTLIWFVIKGLRNNNKDDCFLVFVDVG